MSLCVSASSPTLHGSTVLTLSPRRPTYPALKASEARCTLYMVDPYMVDESKPHEPHPVCEMFPEYEDGVEGIAYTIDGVADDFYDDVDFAATTVYFSDVTMEAEGGLHGGGKLTPNAGSTVTKDSSQGGVRGRRSNRRRLAPTTGTSSLLIVYSKPPDASNSKTPAEMADKLFGTYVGGSDPVNARSQVLACSRNKLEYIPACDDTSAAGCSAAVADSTIVNGVIEVDITSNISGVASGTVVNWATTAANALLGTHGLSTSSFTQVMHVIPDAASWGGAAAWAYLPGSVSAFRSTYSYRMGVQVHEFGHNIGLHHSGFGTASYADHSCLMGNPSYGDDGPQICWNGAKSWESDWYEEDNITVDAKNGATFDGLLVGVADWSSQVYIPGEHKVVVEVPNSSGQNLYLMYNRKKGPNEGVTFAADEVTLTYGSARAVSWHEAALNENESHTIANFDGGSNDLVVTVCEKSTTTAGADTVRVLIYADDTNPLSCATTDPPTTSAPTDEPTSVPSLAPSVSPPTTDPPTTDPPTTDAPTSTPSLAPSVSPPTTDAPTTDAPTSTPSFVPTRAPSESPTYIPTFSPTAGPTSLPTRATSAAPSGSPSTSAAPSMGTSIVGETGKVTIATTVDQGTIVTVTLRNYYNDPIVTAFINTKKGGQSVDVRVRNVTPTSFEIFMQEPDNQGHTAEEVSYIVVERGSHSLEGGVHVEAGKHTTSTVHTGGEDFSGDEISFTHPFIGDSPVLLHSLNTHNNNDFMASMATKVQTDTFEISQEALETDKETLASFGAESIGWIAFSLGSGTNNGSPYIINRVDSGSSNQVDLDLTPGGFADAPDLVASVISENGKDGSWARGSGAFTNTLQGVYAEEDQVGDSERKHLFEPIAYVAFGEESDLLLDSFATGAPTASPSMSSAPTVEKDFTSVGETGHVLLDDTIDAGHFATVNFANTYLSPPAVVVFINTRVGKQSVAARVRSVTTTSCEIFMQEPDNQAHADEYVSYIVMETGFHDLGGGLTARAQISWTDIVHASGESFDAVVDEVIFDGAFSGAPAVLHSLNTHNNNDFMASLVRSVDENGFNYGLEAAGSRKMSSGESLAWIAFSTSTTTGSVTGGGSFVVGAAADGSADGVGQGAQQIPFPIFTFGDKPDVVVSVYGENGTDGSWARGENWETGQQTVFAEEDQVEDSERRHIDEPFAWAAFAQGTFFTSTSSTSLPTCAEGGVTCLADEDCCSGICHGDGHCVA